MVETAPRGRIVANASLHAYLATQPRSFLRRNWNLALDQHETRLFARKGPKADIDALVTQSQEEMVANERRRSGWDYPTKEMLEDLRKGQAPVLILDDIQLLQHGEGGMRP